MGGRGVSRIRGPSSLQQSKHIPQYSNRQLPPLSSAVHLRSLQQLSAPRETHRDNIASCHEGAERDADTRKGDKQPSTERQQGGGGTPRILRSEIRLLRLFIWVVFFSFKMKPTEHVCIKVTSETVQSWSLVPGI